METSSLPRTPERGDRVELEGSVLRVVEVRSFSRLDVLVLVVDDEAASGPLGYGGAWVEIGRVEAIVEWPVVR